ncbi:MAG: NSS family neurotransmitter:Na+ symporter [Rhodothermales bacterium]|jgi:NSS family neurotransmitter:Na+ symporter
MTTDSAGKTTERFSSRWGFFLSVLGIAVGTGNIWRFPRIAAQNGGDDGAGAFLVAWLVFLFAWSIPLIMVEYAWGRKTRSGVVSTFIQEGGKKFAWMGAFVAFVATAITFFYSVVVGWCIYYLIQMIVSPLPQTTEAAMAVWNDYQSGGWPLLFHALAMGLGALAIWKGVASIERVNKVLVPTLLFIVLISVIRALTLPGAWEGVAYLFTPQWSQLAHPKIWIEALTQNAWDTGAGWGLFLTYAAYMSTKQGIVKNAVATAIGNNVVSLMAALMVFATVFAILQTEMGMSRAEVLEVMKTSGPASTGLTFIWMPQLFARMFLGNPLAILFFLGLTFAGFSSLIAQLELPTRVFIDAGLTRPKAIGMVVGVSYLLGIPSAVNLNILSNQDFVWGVALMLSGAMVSFIVIKNGVEKLRAERLTGQENDWDVGYWWVLVVKYFIPIAAIVLLVWWLSQSVTDTWYDPFDTGSLMTVLGQWAVILGLLIAGNGWINRRMDAK